MTRNDECFPGLVCDNLCSLDEAPERCDSPDYYDAKFLHGDYEMECAIVRFDAVSCRQKK